MNAYETTEITEIPAIIVSYGHIVFKDEFMLFHAPTSAKTLAVITAERLFYRRLVN